MSRLPDGMMRIAFYLPQLTLGGAEKSVLWIAQDVQRRGHDVRVIVDRRGGALEPAFAASLPIQALDAANAMLTGPALAKAVRAKPTDVLVAVTTPAILTAALMKSVGMIRANLVGWEHAVLSALPERGMPEKIRTQLVRSLYGQCDKVIFPSYGAAADALKLFKPRRINVDYVTNPAPAPLWQPLSSAEHEIAARLKAPRIVSLGRFGPAKDYLTLLRAFRYLARVKGGSLLLIGDGEERAALETAATGLGLGERVVFAGEVENPANLLSLGDLFVSSSTSEAGGAALLEAMALGLPVVATDCPAAPREILAGGRFGKLIPMGDEKALWHAMRDMLDQPHDRDALRRRAGEFSLDRAADQFLSLLDVAPAAGAPADKQQAA